MEITCTRCERLIELGSYCATCVVCKRFWHADCVTVCEGSVCSQMADLDKVEDPFTCDDCSRQKVDDALKVTGESDTADEVSFMSAVDVMGRNSAKACDCSANPILEELLGCVKTMQISQEKAFNDVKPLMAKCNDDNRKAFILIDDVRDDVEKMEVRLSQSELHARRLEQDNLANVVEIKGIPLRKEFRSNLIPVVVKIADILGVKITPYDVDYACTVQSTSHPPPVNVKFVRLWTKNLILTAKKGHGKLPARDVGFHGNHEIFINQAMTPYYAKLYQNARRLLTNDRLKFVWFVDGRLKVRKQEGLSAVVIEQESDLRPFKNSTSSVNEIL